jgi:hypothetical protein
MHQSTAKLSKNVLGLKRKGFRENSSKGKLILISIFSGFNLWRWDI